MSKSAVTGVRRLVVLLCSWLIASAAVADTFMDPTRPPSFVERGETIPPTSPLLQSVLIAPGRSEAIISGQTVRLGGKFGDAQVIKITETEVVLRNGKDVKTLKLFPNIEKQPIYSRFDSSPGMRGIEK